MVGSDAMRSPGTGVLKDKEGNSIEMEILSFFCVRFSILFKKNKLSLVNF